MLHRKSRRSAGGNCNDVTQPIPLLQDVPPARGKRGRLWRRPDVVLGDCGYDRRLVRSLGVGPLIAAVELAVARLRRPGIFALARSLWLLCRREAHVVSLKELDPRTAHTAAHG